MKRNYPPDRSAADLAEEHQIIEDRLSELYPGRQTTAHKIPISRRGYYIRDLHHVRLDSAMNLHSLEGFVQYCNTLTYHYLKSHQALYLLDTRQLIIYYNELPLSLSEAYNLLLRERDDFTNYSVFCYLNRSGYYCLDPETLTPRICDPIEINPETSNVEKEESDIRPTEPLFKIDELHCSYDSIRAKLRELGPKELIEGGEAVGERLLPIVFDVYKRELFARNKPRRGRLGSPDYFLIVCDENQPDCPSIKQLAQFGLEYGLDRRQQLLFALVDNDNTMSFVHFDPMHPNDLLVDHNAWPEQIRVRDLPRANRF